jgi:hypothetical protein
LGIGDGDEGDIGEMRVGRDDSARVTELGSDFWTGGSGLRWKIPEVPQVWLGSYDGWRPVVAHRLAVTRFSVARTSDTDMRRGPDNFPSQFLSFSLFYHS